MRLGLSRLINKIRGLAKTQAGRRRTVRETGFNAPSRAKPIPLERDWSPFGQPTGELNLESKHPYLVKAHTRCPVNVSLVLQCCLLKPGKYETTLL